MINFRNLSIFFSIHTLHTTKNKRFIKKTQVVPRFHYTAFSNTSQYSMTIEGSHHVKLVLNPHSKDILFGRGRKYQNHPGNQRMRELMAGYKSKYQSLRRFRKHDLVKELYEKLTEEGVRFLKKIEGQDAWLEVEAYIALQKVCHALRCRKHWEKNPSTRQKKAPLATSKGKAELNGAKSPQTKASARPEDSTKSIIDRSIPESLLLLKRQSPSFKSVDEPSKFEERRLYNLVMKEQLLNLLEMENNYCLLYTSPSPRD